MISKHSLSLMSFIIKLKRSLKNKFLKAREWLKSLKLKTLKLKRAKARELNYKLSKTF
ncbi:hypothetical protein HPHPH11_0378 [Helicobacter pylori Hp H-11]|nr:hypothetical protein HPHPH11_0378 [Helicobacter pylori Hp H-11]